MYQKPDVWIRFLQKNQSTYADKQNFLAKFKAPARGRINEILQFLQKSKFQVII